MERNDERLDAVIQRAGGLRSTAHPQGARFYRNGTLVAVDLEEALQRPDRAGNLVLMPGDSIVVPEYDPMVVVQGEAW